jgi:exo-beta-1,3-glucanase (GH17 family)
MRIKSYTLCFLASLLFVLALFSCTKAPDSLPTPTTVSAQPEVLSTPTPSATPTLTPNPTNTPAPTPTRAISQWLVSGSYVGADMDSPCAARLAPAGLILGADPQTCQPAAQEGMAEILLSVPADKTNQIALLQISCSDTGEDCTQAVQLAGPGGTLAIDVDDQRLWQADCTGLALEECASRFLAPALTIAFAAGETAVHHIQITTSANISWQISDIQLTWQPIPSAINGIAYSPFRDCQNPHWGPFPSVEQIREDLLLVRHMGNAIRTYSSLGVQGEIPAIARDSGLRVVAGAWLGPDKAQNEIEIEALIDLVQQDVGIESVIVGNEVLLRGDLTETELIAYIERVKTAVDVPVTSAETIGHLQNHPELIAALDYVMVHIYAYWDGVAIENAAQHTLNMANLTQAIAQGKLVVIGETGWPSNGPGRGAAVPSIENEQRFWHEFLTLARQNGLEFFAFAVFDELWKTEGGVGPYWGLFNSQRVNKFDLQSVYVPMNYETQPIVAAAPLPTATRGVIVVPAEEVLFPVFTNYAAYDNHFAPSSYMGDYQAITYSDCARLTDVWEETAVSIHYDPTIENENGWASIYWQEPENNWGVYPEGYDLTAFTQLRFRAYSPQAGSQVQFFVGGVDTSAYPSSIPHPLYAREADRSGFVTLTDQWQEFHIDLQAADLSHVIDGFGWMASEKKTPDGVTVYIDDIVYTQERLPTAVPLPTVTPAAATAVPNLPPFSIYSGSTLTPGYDMGVDTGPGRLSNWVSDLGGQLCMNYPGGQDWGTVFITNGPPQPPGSRPGQNLSQYARLYVELKGAAGDQAVRIGVKDNSDPDNGTETKFTVTPPLDWQGYSFPLADFQTADTNNLYVMIEFVFGSDPANICFRNVMYLP